MEVLSAAQRSLSATDDSLVRRAARGDVAAFDALMARRLDRCYRLAWSILENEADAADATQEGFVAAWRKLPRLRDLAAFDGWLNRIVANAALMAPPPPTASSRGPGRTAQRRRRCSRDLGP